MRVFITTIFILLSPIMGHALQHEYPDYSDQIPKDYTGKKFRLSQDYPSSIPSTPKRPWENIDFTKDPNRYLRIVRKYIYEGMREADWEVDRNDVRKWYHVPWMHVGGNPREFIHGMTRERDLNPGELGPTQTQGIQNWAVGFYNDYGGYTIGQVWKNPAKPDPASARFPIGTVVAKVLFTAATIDHIPALEGTVEWQANINATTDKDSPKEIQTLRLLQMDFGVRDARANGTTGWVLGTFVYDKRANGVDGWDKMVPVGLMWGNDPSITPTDIANGATLQETFLNPDAPDYAKNRLGWAGRLNGPVDDPESACLSCHSTAQWRPKAPMTPTGTEQERLRWFRNLKSGQTFTEGEISLDYSLQFAISIRNFFDSDLNPAIRPELRSTPQSEREKHAQEGIEHFDLGHPVER
uniref:Cytochrome P460 n=1 Tax=Candidatus Kentrum sp. SD TaxID=2126332 RepID=A0A450YXH7_9GAMM|nr:MAG: hypothetical protein BECKSD772F_GA0070984_106617 [Candidatus Kentron sp. SD]VFK46149.1 MAG: hypothetical protein BECKSD772E_GA0070983_106717 [Candidatus Kentron sp. SD]VFK80896.1 MAG: hypothetical protein BECKSD772D_GA0070982_11752 [Candidatus Kentron sp. SD]